MKKTSIKIIICIITAAAVFISTARITDRFNDRQAGAYRQFEGFYAQPEGSVDVLFVGSSRVHTNIDPAALWEDYGISSYCLGLNSQTINTTYYALKEAFKYQDPKVVVVEASQIPESFERMSGFPSLYGMRYGMNYINAVLEECDPEWIVAALLKFPLYHTGYRETDKEVYIGDEYLSYPRSRASGYKGAVEYNFCEPFDPYTDEYVEEGFLFDDETDGYFDRIVKLCEENSAALIFTLTPAVHRIRQIGVYDYMQRHPEVTFLNTSDHYEEIGMDTAADYIDEGHLNVYGSMKVGRFFGRYLHDNYDLADHRGDAKYVSWDENLTFHYRKLENDELKTVNGFGTYYEHFPKEDYVVIVSLLGDYDREYIGQTDALKHVLCNEAVYKLGGTWVTDGSEIIYGAFGYEDEERKAVNTEDGSAETLIKLGYSADEAGPDSKRVSNEWHADIGNRTFEIRDDEEGLPCILIDNKDYSVYKDYGKTKVRNGIEAVVYDKLSEQVVDAVCFDADNGWAATRNVEDN
ncbi:MAG: hypothetical protein K5886_02950 [Lachnospiraceae bacterium]|nr:hypothetical protein [Lachnospiraceae bacterium]